MYGKGEDYYEYHDTIKNIIIIWTMMFDAMTITYTPLMIFTYCFHEGPRVSRHLMMGRDARAFRAGHGCCGLWWHYARKMKPSRHMGSRLIIYYRDDGWLAPLEDYCHAATAGDWRRLSTSRIRFPSPFTITPRATRVAAF